MNRSIRALSVCALLLVFGCGKENKVDAPGGPVVAAPPITDFSVIRTATDRSTLVDRRVDLARVPAQRVTGNYFFWAGDIGAPMPVARLDKLRGAIREHVRGGENVHIVGTIRSVSTMGPADPLWPADAAHRAEVQAARVYIAADQVSIVP